MHKCVPAKRRAPWRNRSGGKEHRLKGSDPEVRLGDKIQSLCPGAQLVKTSAYSHQKILAAPELAQTIGAFLQKESIT